MATTAHAKAKRKKKKPNARKSTAVLSGLDVGELISQVREGFPFAAFDELVERTGISRESMADAIQVPLRTLARRKEEGRFHADESDRLWRIARILDLCVKLFEGDVTAARAWLMAEQMALGGSTPLDYAGTEIGAREVEALIGRLEHGIPS